MEKVLQFFKENKILVLLTGGVFVILVLFQIILFIYFNYKLNELNNYESTTIEPTLQEEPEKTSIFVEIKGEVVTPGTYEMNNNDRIVDVIKKAGGLTKNANIKANNLSKKVEDEMVIIIYSNNEIKEFETIKQKEEQVSTNCHNSSFNITNSSCKNEINDNSKNNQSNALVSINTATKEELMTISGIGESKALSIIEYRSTNGKFNSIEDIKNVSGIGDKLYAQIKNFITT